MTSAQERKIRQTGCDVRFDNLTRQLYATDASIYQIEPRGVAFPKGAEQASAVIRAAADAGVSVTPRGAGTSLVGNAIGEGLIVEFSRYNRQITDLDLEKRSLRVGAGVVLDHLNDFLRPHGFCFGPDVATSSRATLGGMIANNSSGARCPVYGTTADHVTSLEVVMADGRIEKIGPGHESLCSERADIENLIRARSAEMAERWPPGLIKRWPGYGIERFLRAPNDLTNIFAGSEGTLAAIFSAELKISPLPSEKGLGLIFFSSVDEAMQATVELLDLKPAAIEHIDRPLLDQTKGQLHFQGARDLLELDTHPCESILIVEFYDDVTERLSILQARKIGLRTKILTEPAQMNLVWSVRKAGLSLLTGCIGPAKPVAFIEDAAVRPAQLPEYVRGLRSIMQPLGLEASYYGHAASGLLHVRPVLDLHNAKDLKRFRLVADQTSALVRQFKGSLSAEHGVGIARTEYMQEQLGDELLEVMREIKRMFDPKNIFNPGKIFEVGSALRAGRTSRRDGLTRIDNHLRENFTRPLELPFEPVLAFAFKDRSFISNVDLLGKIGCAMPALANRVLNYRPVRFAMEKTIGLSARRSLPHYAKERFDKWFAKHCSGGLRSPLQRRGRVILWDDTFVRYHEPHIGIAAVKVLEALEFEVSLARNRRCCGRPAFSQGNLDAASKLARHNISQLSTLNSQPSAPPILFLEPSCWSMFVEDYRELKIENAEKIANHCFLFEKFIDDRLAQEPDALPFNERSASIAIHPHCHAKSIMNPAFMRRLAERLPGRKATVLDTACCGMAGAFGALAEKYDLSVQVAQDLMDKLENQGRETQIIASGTSCRHQITDLTNIRPKHMAEVLAEALL